MMSLQRLLWPAGGIAVAVSFANTTVYAAEEKAKMQTLYKPSELPLYGDPEPAMFELIESEGTRYTHAVSSVRKQTWDFLESIQVSVNTNTLCH
ncbi:hypothetical protein LSAT2_004093 [Lamellibrachia satsuma]|nr:hypothetical protein LSAT2_004093 [Lamellibrachia satsuma]